jgi:hypothetical protein
MPKDYSGPYHPGDMSDNELRDLVVQQLADDPNLDVDWIDVSVREGFVTLGGTVGTDGEKQVAEKVIADVIGVESYANELVVNELHRGELPEAADASDAREREADDHLGYDHRPQSDTAAHHQEDLEAETFGTRDMLRSIQEGATYNPPDRPIPDGYESEEEH